MIKKIELRDQANVYIKEELAQGGVLSRVFMNWDMNKFSVWAYLPIELEEYSSLDFSDGLEYGTNSSSAELRKETVYFILNYLNESNNRIAVFETFWSRSDSITSKRNCPYFFVDDKKYNFLRGNATEELVQACIIASHAYPRIFFLSTLSTEAESLVSSITLSKNTIDSLISNIDYLLIGAFDDEGYLVLRHKSSSTLSGGGV